MCIFAESEARTRGEHEGIERRREDKKGIKKKRTLERVFYRMLKPRIQEEKYQYLHVEENRLAQGDEITMVPIHDVEGPPSESPSIFSWKQF